MNHHQAYRPGEALPERQDDYRKGTTARTVLTVDGPIRVEAPRVSRLRWSSACASRTKRLTTLA
jgi:transposase-like protein